ncbi:abequosyltransferase [Sphingomonas sp. BK036]|nr:abequosyltransferase [Sphingomonas sp. BK036]
MRLSICVPTYNRAPELRVMLDSLMAQTGYGLDVEIVISDNASTDDTPTLVASYADRDIPIVYHRLTDNLGFDRNILNAVACASGDYCWLFGSDDVLLDTGAFARVERVLAVYPMLAGISLGSDGYNHDMTERTAPHNYIATNFAAETLLNGRGEIISSVGPWFGYMSSIVVRREAWARAVDASPIEPYLNGYVHTYVVARSLDEQSTWVCVPDILVGCRLGNDSFQGRDTFARTQLDMVGYERAFGDTLGRDHWAYRSAMAKVSAFYVRTHFLGAKIYGAGSPYWKQAIPMSVSYYWRYPTFWMRTFPIAITPRPLMLMAQAIFRRTLKRRGIKAFA